MILQKIHIEALRLAYEFHCKSDVLSVHYHNIKHVKRVIKQSQVLASVMRLDNKEREVLFFAAVFHDVGYYINYYNHEFESAAIARTFLTHKNSSAHLIDEVCKLILISDKNPQTALEKIFVDADYSNLGSKQYFTQLDALSKEWAVYFEEDYTQKEWIALNIEFLSKHRFYTDAAEKMYGSQKKSNLNDLKILFHQNKF